MTRRLRPLVPVLLAIAANGSAAQYYREQKEVVARNGVVASCDDRATEEGLRVLREGGNAVDAAVTIAFLMAVYEPYNSGIGGHGGHMAFYHAATDRYLAIDASARAPARATPSMFEVLETPTSHEGDVWRVRVKDDLNHTGFRAMFAPSTVAGYWHLVENYGTLSWQQVMAPAIRVAEEGFLADELYVRAVRSSAGELSRFEGSRDMYLPNGKLPEVGDRIVFPDLARTLKRLSQGGRDLFYEGEIADEIVDYVQANGGILAREDFESYRVEETPLTATQYRGHTILTYPQASNGATVAETLNILASFDLRRMEFDSAQSIHVFIEALKLAFIDRYEYSADRDLVPVPYDGMMSWSYGRERARSIDPGKARIFEPGDPWSYQASGRAPSVRSLAPSPSASYRGDGVEDTTFLCAADKDGNLLLLTTSLLRGFGSKVTVPGLGITLNSSMYSLNPSPGHPLSIAPFKRALRNSGPVIVVKDEKPYMILSAPGGRHIITAILRTLVNVLDYGMGIQAAIDAPRIHSEANLYEVFLEDRVPEAVREELARMGHEIVVRPPYSDGFALVQGILVDPETGLKFGGSDPRTHGGARGY
jgi:gamma-glutamyltranspeptidase/glutathione hydrolase